MTTVEIDKVATRLLPVEAADRPGPLRVQGKFFFAGAHKHFIKGVTYGPFAKGDHGAQFPEPPTVELDFALMAQAGVNTVRVFTVPPIWLLDAAFTRRARAPVYPRHDHRLRRHEPTPPVMRFRSLPTLPRIDGCAGP